MKPILKRRHIKRYWRYYLIFGVCVLMTVIAPIVEDGWLKETRVVNGNSEIISNGWLILSVSDILTIGSLFFSASVVVLGLLTTLPVMLKKYYQVTLLEKEEVDNYFLATFDWITINSVLGFSTFIPIILVLLGFQVGAQRLLSVTMVMSMLVFTRQVLILIDVVRESIKKERGIT